MRRLRGQGARVSPPPGRAAGPTSRAGAAGLLFACILAAAAGCAGSPSGRPAAATIFPAARFAVIADPHVFDTSSSSAGPAWDRALGSGIKLLAESGGILDAAIDAIAAEEPDFVLVCGDITKDGERMSHELAARKLAGLRVLVVPGNHDVGNPHAARFEGIAAHPVAGVGAGEFASIHAGAGYAGALSRDPASLSYASEPVKGLCVVAIDACRYGEGSAHPVTAGRVRPATLAWAAGILADARARGAAVIVFLHHGLAPHYPDQATFDPSRIAAGSRRLARLLSDAGVRVVFTGHGHAQDAVTVGPPGGGLVDVQTGSLVTFPNPWRLVTLEPDGTMRIESRFVSSVASRTDDFRRYSQDRLREGVDEVLAWGLGRAGARKADAESLARQAAGSVALFYQGDEKAGEVVLDTDGMCGWGAFLGNALEGPLTRMANDAPPSDNDLVLDLAAPAVRPAPPIPPPAGDRR